MRIGNKATLRLWGDALTQEHIDQYFGRAPRVLRHGNTSGISHWSLDSEHDGAAPLADHIAELAEFIRGQMQAFTDAGRGFDAAILCHFASENSGSGFALSPADMAILGQADVELQVWTDGGVDAATEPSQQVLPFPMPPRVANTWRQSLCQKFDLAGFVSGIADEVTPYRFGIKCQCPLHRGADHSFVVDNRRKRWHCFGSCAQGGDAVTLLALFYQITEEEALKRLTQMVQEAEL